MENVILNKARATIKDHWKNLLLFVVLLVIISKYTDLYKLILNASQQTSCVSTDENVLSPCKKLLELSGRLVFLFSFITMALLIFKQEKENIIKMLFLYFSAATVLYTTGIGYTDIEGQKLQLKLNQEYYIAQQETELLALYKNNHEKDKFEKTLKIKELELSIANREFFYKVQLEEAKMYLQYKVTASIAIIIMSYSLLVILLLQLNIGRLKIIGISLLLLFLAYPNI